ncbi:hypothetical protein [Nocardia sp. NPDC049526]|uniref:hypothetical protein n=1 Tax=Nocardia sp. NPDC049526 TaxID=3364316 RepID=UPI0037A91618
MVIQRILELPLRRRRDAASWSAADETDARRTAVVRDLQRIRRADERNRPRERNPYDHTDNSIAGGCAGG